MNANDDRLKTILSGLVKDKNVTVTKATFVATKDFNIAWNASRYTLSMTVSDYLDDAPGEVIREFLRGALTYIYGGKHVFGKKYLDYIKSDEFILRKRPIFYKRSRNIARTDVGRYRNLFDSVDRLLDRGLLDESDIDNTVFSWSKTVNTTRLGYCAQMFRVVVISAVFDDDSIPERYLDYVVYHECLHLRQGYRPFDRHPHDSEFHRQESLYPGFDEINDELNTILERIKRKS